MKFDINRVYTAVNADELKVGSKVMLADNLANLKTAVENDNQSRVNTITNILAGSDYYRFVAGNLRWAFAYLVSEPEEKKLKWTDLKLLDKIQKKDRSEEGIVVHIDRHNNKLMHVCCGYWIFDKSLEEEWEKVDTELEEYERQVTE